MNIPWMEIFEHVDREVPREACGVLGIAGGSTKYFPCKNVSKEYNQFEMDASDFIRAQLKSKVKGIVHSHISTNGPSQADRKQCNRLGIPYYIVCQPTREIYTVLPLKGREYVWEESDCYTLAADYYKQELNLDFPRGDFLEYWWKEGLDYFNEIPQQMGFLEVTDNSLQKHDLILFNVQTSVPNHCGVYTGQGNFIHHARNRLSCEESLYPMWGKYKYKVLRHESLYNG